MPLPWLIGAAVVAAATVVVKAINDDDSSSSSDSGDSERRTQEREARLKRERDGLAAKMDGLKKDRLIEASDLLARSLQTLSLPPRRTDDLSTADFEGALAFKLQSQSAYARGLGGILAVLPHSQSDLKQKERSELWINLQLLESLAGPFILSAEEQRDLASLQEVGSRLDRLQRLKQLLEK